MRPVRGLSRALCRRSHFDVARKRHITTPTAATLADIRNDLLQRQPEVCEDHLHPRNLQLLSLTLPGLGLDDINTHHAPLLSPGGKHAVLPQGHHLVFFPPPHRSDHLLPDGTDRSHWPGPPFTRRLWASGSVSFSRGWKTKLLVEEGMPWVCRESITNVRLAGVPNEAALLGARPGPNDKLIVDIERLYSLGSRLTGTHEPDPVIVETRTLCFLTPMSPDAIKKALEQPVDRMLKAPHLSSPSSSSTSYSQAFTLTPAMLFRFSALTFNAHKIHLDPNHCREVEGYRDLLVHGPLILLLMLAVLNKRGHIVASLDYRNLAPVYVGETITVCVQQRKHNWAVWIAGPHDDLRVRATAVLDGDV